MMNVKINVKMHQYLNDGFRYPSTVRKDLAHHTGEEVITNFYPFYHQRKPFLMWSAKCIQCTQKPKKSFTLHVQVAVYAIGPQSHLFRGLEIKQIKEYILQCL